MSQEKRFGKRVAMPSTLQIIRELKILMRNDVESGKADAAAIPGQDGMLPVVATPPSAFNAQ